MRRTKYLFSTRALLLFASVLMAVALLLGSIGFTAQAATPANDGKFYSDFLSYDEMLAAGRDANAEIAAEGITLLKNRQNVLPLKNVKRVSVFGKNGVDPYYHGFGAGAAQSTLDPVTLYEGLQMAGYETNDVLKAFYENDARSGSDRTIGELIGEAPVSSYDAAVKRSFDRYNDAAIVCISRAVNEGKDAIRTYAHDQAEDPESVIEKDRHYLELSKNEEDMIEYIKALGFDKIIVLINSANAFEVAPLMADDAIDGLLWISSPGYDGFRALGEILNGTINPSGHLVDTWYSDFTKDPTWFNFGDNSQTSPDGKTPNYQYRDAATGEPLAGVQFKEFVQYEEGIYVDYRYYETVYADMVASDGKEAADAWYAENVVFPFGYGMSYSDFAVTDVQTSIAAGSDLRAHKDGKIVFEVTVENTGSVAGKDVVQLYYHAPYIDGEIEKAEEVLGAFAKTDMLAPGESDTVTLEVYIQDMASYDFEDKNGNGTKGYELDPGDYRFSVRSDAHTAFAVKEESVAVTYEYTVSGSDAIYYPNDRITGSKVENRFDSTQEADGTFGLNNYNSLPDPVGSVGMTRMTRASSAHFVMPQAPTVEEASLEKTDSLYQKIVDAFYIGDLAEGDFRYKDKDDAKATDGSTTVQFTQAASAADREIELTFPDMIGVESDDIKWEKFMNQLTYDELVQVVSQGRKMVVALPDFEMPSAWLDNGPTCVAQVDYGSGNLLAATWNIDMAELMGSMVGEESLWIGRHGWYGPSVNIHRSAFGGRNNEYFSADPYLSGTMAAYQIAKVQEKGVYVMAKHFALNEQETARSGIATYVDEQTMREIYLKPFQMAVQQGKALGIMSAMNKIGDTSSYACYALDMLILRGEWGFNGFIVTDSGPTATPPTPTTEAWPVAATFVNIWQQNISGNDLSLINTSAANLKYYGEWDDAEQTVVYTPEDGGAPVETTSLWLAVRESAKRIIFANAQSCLSMNGVDTSTFSGEKEITVGKDVEFYETVAIEGDLATDDIRYYISEGSLPEGVTLGSDGQISGIATEVGRYEFTVTLQADSWNQASKDVVLNVVTSSELTGMDGLAVGTAVNAAVGTDFIYKDYRRIGPIKAGIQLWWITLDYSFELYDGALPDGLSLSSDGKITGTPTAAGTYEFTINIAATEEASALQQYNTPVTPDYLTTFTVTVGDGTGTAPGGEEGTEPGTDAGTQAGGAPLALGIAGIAVGSVGLIVALVAVVLKRK